MVENINRVILLGYLGQNPQFRRFHHGQEQVCNLMLATNENWIDGDGGRQHHVEWHRVSFYGELAEVANNPSLCTGCLIYVEGKLQTNNWKAPDGSIQSIKLVVGHVLNIIETPYRAQESVEVVERTLTTVQAPRRRERVIPPTS
ncbi:hypothetical protein CCR95_22400 [Thiocystis minor]|uniref:single-stranded DNA-binding protein n=1 Tax=Thiocystis minor TaxID=61597 RepID=UPI0019148066|nr:single-stranded DNA-binding protein [Thiocystis minor]MBK5966750.1 hypothetical protein [Thiocystis minor]